MYDVRRMAMLLEIHERGSISSAARTLHLTPSAISQQMAALEKEVGQPLLQKEGRFAQLTQAGLVIAEGARQVLRELDTTATRIARLSGEPAGAVRIAMFQSAAMALLTPTLDWLAANAPQVRLIVHQIDPETGLDLTTSRLCDAVIAETYPGYHAPAHPELDLQLLTSDTLQLVVSADSPITSLSEAAPLPWVLEGSHNTSRSWAINQCRAAGFEPQIRYDIEDLLTHCHLARTGHAAAILPGFATATLPEEFGVKIIDLPGRPHRNIYTAVRQDSAQAPAIVAVRQALANAVEQLAL